MADSYLTIINVVWIKLYIAAIGEQVRIWIKVEERKSGGTKLESDFGNVI